MTDTGLNYSPDLNPIKYLWDVQDKTSTRYYSTPTEDLRANASIDQSCFSGTRGSHVKLGRWI